MPFPGCRINQAVVEAIIRAAAISSTASGALDYCFVSGDEATRDQAQIDVLFPSVSDPTLAAVLFNNPGLVLQVHYALAARSYDELDGWEPPRPITVSIPQICDDLEIARKRSRDSHTTERKLEVLSALRLLTKTDVSVRYHLPGKTRLYKRVSPVWIRHGERYDRAAGDMDWNPTTFVYSPGAFWDDPDWRRHNRFCGLVARSLMQFQAGDRDKWAILLGAYLASIARSSHYQNKTIAFSTILHKLGLDTAYPKDRGKRELKLTVALGKLAAYRVIRDWYEIPDRPDGDRMLKIRWPEELAEVGTAHSNTDWDHREQQVRALE